jgi:hypothetical protein
MFSLVHVVYATSGAGAATIPLMLDTNKSRAEERVIVACIFVIQESSRFDNFICFTGGLAVT